MVQVTSSLSGRQAQAARNDEVILNAARVVFLRDPKAPIAEVAREAGVGISALYRRYDGKERLLQSLFLDGLERYVAIAEAALTRTDPSEAFDDFLRGVVEADVHSLTVQLAGTFTPTEQLRQLAAEAGRLAAKLLRRAKAAGAVRADLQVNDLAMIQEQMAAVRLPDSRRTSQLRERYLALVLDGLRPDAARRLPGSPPTGEELGRRWTPRT
jgi:AcrR family transcriptional regulator